MAVNITTYGPSDEYWTLEEMSETVEFRSNPNDSSNSPKRQYRHHATVVLSRLVSQVWRVSLDGAVTEAAGGLLNTGAEIDVNACTGLRDSGSSLLWNLITGALGCVYDSDSYAKITLLSDSLFPEADYSTVVRRVQEWDAVSNWKEYTGDV